jgi:hypothetical protein
MAGAIKAIIATQFDATGIKAATKEFDRLGRGIRNTLGAVGLGLGLAAVTNGLKESAKAAVADVKSQALLAQQLKNTVGATDEAIAGSEAYIKSLMLQTSVADDELRPALATLVRATDDLAGAQSLLGLSTDVAAGTGLGLETVAKAIGKAVNGQSGALKKLGIVIQDGEDPVKALTLAFGGMAAAAANNDPFQRINVIMGEMQETIGMALLPTLNDFAAWFASPEGQAKVQEFVDTIVAAIKVLVDFANFVAANIEVFTQLAIGIGGTTIAIGLFNLALNTNPIFLFIGALGALATALQVLQPNINAAANGVPLAVNRAASKAGQAAYEKAMRDPRNFEMTSTGPKLKTGAAMVAEKARMDAFQAEVKKYKDGIKQADKAALDTKSFSPFVPAAAPSKSKGKSKADTALEKAQKALDNFKKSLAGIADFSNLTKVSKDLGAFEQSVVDTFDGINKKLAEGLANKTIGTKNLAKLKATLASYNDLLLKNAQQRDAIIKKRSLAEALINDVKGALTGTGSLASLLDTQTKQVTTSVTKIVDGFAVTTKRTVDEVIGAKGVVGRLKDVVAKTKAFANQLKDLKAAGLSPDLFKQIVDAGPDVGGQLATEILAGGADSVTALNDTFKELETVSAQVAEQTAVVMYNNGVEVAGGLVNGLLSQEQALVDAAKTLADAFNAAYQAQVMDLAVPTAPKVTPKVTSKTTNVTVNNTIRTTQGTKKDAEKVISLINKYTGANGYGYIQNAKLL